MPKIHRVGDFDTAKNMASTGSDNVFANGGPTLGGTISEVFDLPDAVGISDLAARMILSDRSDEINRSEIDPDENEALEQFDAASGKGINPVDGSTDIQGAPGSPAAGTSGGFGAVTEHKNTQPFDNSQKVSEWLRPEPQVNMNVSTDTFNKTIKLAKALGKPLVIRMGYCPSEYNLKIGGAKKGLHVQGTAIDIRWPVGDFSSRLEFIQLVINSGFTGIGVNNAFIHCDTGTKRCWGPSGGRASVYQQYVSLLKTNGYTVG
jgi:hypothetical protein|tara:strand:- start:539 stop:1324 length:786 start_codon:yes stop_codon:yes gene_type:complete